MITETLKELMQNQHYCMIVTCDYPLEGFVTNLKDDNIEMYIFSTKSLSDDEIEDIPEGAMEDRVIERVVFPVSHIEYIYPDHYQRLPFADVKAKEFLKNQILNQRKASDKKLRKSRKKNDEATQNN